MAWTERQQAMLQAMGLPVWEPRPGAAVAPLPPPVPVPLSTAHATRDESAEPVPETDEAPMPAQPSAAPRRPAPPAAAPSGLPMSVPAESAWSALDWPALGAAVADCRACGLCEGRRHTVFGTGHPQAHWMIVGEAPGEQEDLRGEPFVGPAGQLLDQMLAALGLSRADGPPASQVFITNTLKCRPPANRNPSPQELAQCRPFLERQIALVQPRILLALGRFAALALLGSDAPLGRLRGQIHQAHGVPVVVTYHPAYLLRQPAEKAKAWEDLCLAASVIEAEVAPPA